MFILRELANNGLKNNDKNRIKYLKIDVKIRTKSKSATNSESVGYKIVFVKVLNWTSKGR